MAYIHVRVDNELQRRFKMLCAKHGFTMSDVVRLLVVKEINDERIGQGMLVRLEKADAAEEG